MHLAAIRESWCLKCPTPCAPVMNFGDPASACPLGTWKGAQQRPAPAARPVSLQSEPRPARPAPKPFDGSRHWEALHRRDWGAPDTPEWFARVFLPSLPCGQCRRHFRAILAELPPIYERAAGFARTVEWHNAVNRLLDRHEWDECKASAKWLQ